MFRIDMTPTALISKAVLVWTDVHGVRHEAPAKIDPLSRRLVAWAPIATNRNTSTDG